MGKPVQIRTERRRVCLRIHRHSPRLFVREAVYGGRAGDHGELEGLGGDDHPQYYNAARLPAAIAHKQDKAGPRLSRVRAGETLGGHRAVVLGSDGRAYYASQALESHGLRFLGITTHAAVGGDWVDVITEGTLAEGFWAWVSGDPIYLGLAGALTQVQPSSGLSMVIGVALAATLIKVNPQPAIKRA